MAQYVEHVLDVPKLLDFGDMDSHKWIEYANYKPMPMSWGYQFEGAKMKMAEKRLARRFDLCTATTRAEWQTLEDYATGTATDWFPNGVDSEFFCPGDEPHDVDTISFIGRMDYYPNQECMSRFCDQVWPLLRARRPNLKLLIVGADPSPAMRRLGERPGVTVTGSVPDVRPYVRKSRSDGRAAGHRPRNPEQDFGGDGDGCAGSHEPCGRRRGRRRGWRASCGS